jgi:Kef-type K+ transport system membrane component KefB
MLFVTHNFLEDMALVMCVAALAAVFCQLLQQPLVVGYLVAGMVVGRPTRAGSVRKYGAGPARRGTRLILRMLGVQSP